jgi:hypothetical protein
MLKKIILFVFVASIISSSCKKTYEHPDASVVINEVMPVNSSTAADQDGEYDDWIELFNLTSASINLSGYYLSDDKKELTKWQFPEGTYIPANGYLIIWADNDYLQQGLHASFKLSSTGESVVFSTPDKVITDKISYEANNLELSYSRVPNGTGDLKWQTPTFNRSNGSK